MDQRPPLIGLVRVSTEKQADSGLGLEGQLAAIDRFRQSINGDLIETYTEVESGKHNDIESRPRLREAAEHALEVGATLVIAKLDRLVRSVSVLVYLRDRKVKFVACDYPHVSDMVVGIMVVIAEGEAKMISDRTKDALKAYRDGRRVSKRIRALYPDGVPPEIIEATAGRLGAELDQCRNLTDRARAKGRARSLQARKIKARKSSETIGKIIDEIRAEDPGVSMAAIAAELNRRRRKTPRGKAWTGKQVQRVLDRLRPP